MGTPWIVRPITLRGGQEIVFEPGVVVLAKRGEFKGTGDSLFRADGVSDITLRGYGATMRMWKEDYAGPDYEHGEWRMALDFGGCARVRVLGLRIENSGGDGIYIGVNNEDTPYCEDVIIRDVVCSGNHRQGISVISAVNLLIENCIMSNTDGTAPQAGIDLEPNQPHERLADCIVRNCTMENNTGAGILVYAKQLTRESEPISVLFENCHVRGGSDVGIGVGAIKTDGPQGAIEFKNCTVEGAVRGGIFVYDTDPANARVRFVNCNWKDVGLAQSPSGKQYAPLKTTLLRPALTERHGGMEFVDCHVYDTLDRPFFIVGREKYGVRDVKGTITVHNPHGARMALGPNQADVDLQITEIKQAARNACKR